MLAHALDRMLAWDVQLVLLGTGDPEAERVLRRARPRPARPLRAWFGFDDARAHRIEAGADFFLMPSRFEPCGLNQMYSLRYGTLPIVRATGGLVDTVDNYDEGTGPAPASCSATSTRGASPTPSAGASRPGTTGRRTSRRCAAARWRRTSRGTGRRASTSGSTSPPTRAAADTPFPGPFPPRPPMRPAERRQSLRVRLRQGRRAWRARRVPGRRGSPGLNELSREHVPTGRWVARRVPGERGAHWPGRAVH